MIDYEKTDKQYFAMDGLNASHLKNVLKSCQYAKYVRDNPIKASEAMHKGTVFHSAILEPVDFTDRFLVLPKEIKVNTIKGKTFAKEYFNELGYEMPDTVKKASDLSEWLDYEGIETITHNLQHHALLAKTEVLKHDETREILKTGKPEVVVTGEIMGVQCKAKLDWLTPCNQTILDVKTCQDASYWSFQRDIAKYNYALQAAFYHDLLWSNTGDAPQFGFKAVETKQPIGTALYWASQDMIEYGRSQYEKAIELWLEAEKTGIYPGYQNGSGEEIDMPAWEYKKG